MHSSSVARIVSRARVGDLPNIRLTQSIMRLSLHITQRHCEGDISGSGDVPTRRAGWEKLCERLA